MVAYKPLGMGPNGELPPRAKTALEARLSFPKVVRLEQYGAVTGNIRTTILAAIAAMNPGDTLVAPANMVATINDSITIATNDLFFDWRNADITVTVNYTSAFIVTSNDVWHRNVTVRNTKTGDEYGPTLPKSYGAGFVYRQTIGGGLVDVNTWNCGAPTNGTQSNGRNGSGAGVWLSGASGCTIIRHKDDGSFMSHNTDDYYGISKRNYLAYNEYKNSRLGYVADLQARVESTGDVVTNTQIHDIFEKGMIWDAVRNGGLVEDVEIWNCGDEGLAILHETANMDFNMVWSHNNRIAMVLFQESGRTPSNLTFRRSIFEKSTLFNIQLYGSRNITWYSCVSRFAGSRGVYSMDGTYNMNYEWHGFDCYSNGTHGFEVYDLINWRFFGGNIYNNSVITPGASSGFVSRESTLIPRGLQMIGTNFAQYDSLSQSQQKAVWVTHVSAIAFALIACNPGEIAYTVGFVQDDSGLMEIISNYGQNNRIRNRLMLGTAGIPNGSGPMVTLAPITTEPTTGSGIFRAANGDWCILTSGGNRRVIAAN